MRGVSFDDEMVFNVNIAKEWIYNHPESMVFNLNIAEEWIPIHPNSRVDSIMSRLTVDSIFYP